MILNNDTWPSYAKRVASPKDPDEYSPQAIENLMVDLDSYIVDVKGVHPQFKALNRIQMMQFRNAEERAYYQKAYDRFLMEKAKIEEKAGKGSVGNSGMQILVEFLKFRQAAEEIKVESICDAMVDAVNNYKQAAVAAFNFKFSIAKAVKYLNERYGISRDNISLIWGGGNSSMSKERKKKLDMKKKIEGNDMLKQLFAEADIDMYDLGLNTVDEQRKVVIDETLRLGSQSKEERQKEIDRFQRGKSLFCFYTFKSGGVGLSLHHTDESTKEKVRRKTNGFAVEEDISSIPTRQRVCFVSTTYSAFELVQGLGRCPRLTSLSDTPQTILFYSGTIEEQVAYIVSTKLKCLRKVVQQKESWEDCIMGGVSDEDGGNRVARDIKLLEEGKPIEDESGDGEIIEIESEEE